MQRHGVDAEVIRDLLDRHSGFKIRRDAHHVVADSVG